MAPAATPVSDRVAELREIQVTRLIPSATNPRRHVDNEADLQLLDSVRSVGILEPLIARPFLSGYEVVAGHRRLKAATAAGLLTVPVLVRQLSDAEALEIAVIENNQRTDVHPLDEATAFERLVTEAQATPADIAAKIGRPTRYVVDRLKLLDLSPPVFEAFDADRISLGHAQLLVKVPRDRQADALKACFERVFAFDTTDTQVEQLQPVGDLKAWVAEHIPLDVKSPEVQEDFPELVAEVAQAEAAGATVLMLSDEWYRYDPKPGDPILRSKWEESKAKDAVLGVIVEGRRRGKTLRVKLKAEPPKGSPQKAAPKTAAQKDADRKAKEAEQARREAEEAKAARAQQVRTRAINGLVLSISPERWMSAPVLRLLADVIVGGDTFDGNDLSHAASALGVSREVFSISGGKARAKLSAEKLRSVIAVLAVGYEFAVGIDDDFKDACSVFGISLTALDKVVAKEMAAHMKKSAAPKAKAKAGKVKTR